MEPVIFVFDLTDNMCEWLNDNHVVHNISFRQIGWHSCTSIWMSEQNMIYFKLKWDDYILTEEQLEDCKKEWDRSFAHESSNN